MCKVTQLKHIKHKAAFPFTENEPYSKKKKANRYTVFSFVQQSKAQDEKKKPMNSVIITIYIYNG